MVEHNLPIVEEHFCQQIQACTVTNTHSKLHRIYNCTRAHAQTHKNSVSKDVACLEQATNSVISYTIPVELYTRLLFVHLLEGYRHCGGLNKLTKLELILSVLFVGLCA